MTLRGLDGQVLLPGDSGGGVWLAGSLLGSVWAAGVHGAQATTLTIAALHPFGQAVSKAIQPAAGRAAQIPEGAAR
jgi:hypothetical protein